MILKKVVLECPVSALPGAWKPLSMIWSHHRVLLLVLLRWRYKALQQYFLPQAQLAIQRE